MGEHAAQFGSDQSGWYQENEGGEADVEQQRRTFNGHQRQAAQADHGSDCHHGKAENGDFSGR
jgi:hypothetical protein